MLEVHFDEEISLPHKSSSSPIKLDVKVRCWKGSSVKFKDLATFNLELSGVAHHGEQTKIQGGPSGFALAFDDNEMHLLVVSWHPGTKKAWHSTLIVPKGTTYTLMSTQVGAQPNGTLCTARHAVRGRF